MKATVPGAGSTETGTIKSFIEEQLALVNSESISGMHATAETLKGMGFSSSANVKYSEFLTAFTEEQALRAHYEKEYPDCVFLPWSAMHVVMKSMDLWLDLPSNYTGAVPGAQLPWIEMFEMGGGDTPRESDVHGCIGGAAEEHVWYDKTRDSYRADGTIIRNPSALYEAFAVLISMPSLCTRAYDVDHAPSAYSYMASDVRQAIDKFNYAYKEDIAACSKQFKEGLFVVAPAEAFKTTEDWLTRARTLAKEAFVKKDAPDDPLVVKFVRGGCLIVAAWGDEAAVINKAVRDLKL